MFREFFETTSNKSQNRLQTFMAVLTGIVIVLFVIVIWGIGVLNGKVIDISQPGFMGMSLIAVGVGAKIAQKPFEKHETPDFSAQPTATQEVAKTE